MQGAVEKSYEQRSPQFSVLTYGMYAPRAKLAWALLENFLNRPEALDVQRRAGHLCQ